MEKSKKKSLFDSPLLSTKVKSFKVKLFPEAGLGYFIGPVLAILSNSIMNQYLNKYFTDILKLTEWANLFSILLPVISVIFVVLGNILVGKLMSNSKTRAGKARPLLLVAAPLIALSLFIMFYTPQPVDDPTKGGSLATLIWVAIAYNLYYAVAYPFYFTSHSALVTLSTRDTKARSLLATISNATSLAAMGLTSMVLPFFIGYLFVNTNTEENPVYDVYSSANAWKIFILAMIVLSLIGIVIEYYFTRERITEESFTLNADATIDKPKPIKTSQQAKACLSDKYWWIIIVFFFLYQLGGMMKNTSQLYYSQSWFYDVVNGAKVYSVKYGGAMHGTLSIIGAIPTALGMVIAWPLSNKIGKARAIMLGAILACAGGFVGFIAPDNFYVVATSFVLKALGSTPAMYISLALLSDMLDHNEAKNGFRSDGFTMTIYGAIMIGMSGIANGILNGVLSLSNYDINNLGGNNALREGLKWLFLGGESICYGLIAIMFLFMNVEKFSKSDRDTILAREKARCLAEGREWIEPEERIRLEQEEIDRITEENRLKDLRAYCTKKNLDFDTEERKYQDALVKKNELKAQKEAEKRAKKEAKAKEKEEKKSK